MTLPLSLTALCDMLQTETGAQVRLGFPVDAPGLYVWPWRLAEDEHLQRAPAPASAEAAQRPAPPANRRTNVDFLVLVRPALTTVGLNMLDATRRAIAGHPVLSVADERVQVELRNLALADLAALFEAADQPLTICLSATLRGIS